MSGISRRSVFLSSFAAVARRKILICLVDGLGPEYVTQSDMPNFQRAGREGRYTIGRGMMPSLTNVNNASLATGAYPERHGVTANTFFDPVAGKIVEMAEAKYLMCPTLFASARKKGLKTAFVGAKDKIRGLISTGADVSVSAEKEGIPMYEAENTYWVLDRGRQMLRRPEVDLLYLTTSDYIMHTYGPETAESREHLHKFDALFGGLLDDHSRLEVYLCADHGMNAKTRAADPERILGAQGIAARAVPAIADKHKIHHKDLGGSIYIDLEDRALIGRAREILAAEPGIEAVLTRGEAARRFRLMPERTGDLFLLGDKVTALGALDKERRPGAIRTHGSLHETAVPLLVYGRKFSGALETTVHLTAGRVWER